MTQLRTKHDQIAKQLKPTDLMKQALDKALSSAKMNLHDLDALIAIPSLSHPHFMEAHHFATKLFKIPQ